MNVVAPAPLTILDRDYVAILDRFIVEQKLTVSRGIKFCAAKLLQIFERLTSWKAKSLGLALEQCWFWIPIIKTKPLPTEQCELFEAETKSPPRSLYDELQGEYCRDTIRKAINLLKDFNLIRSRNNPYNGQDRTRQYQTNLVELKRLKSFVQAAFKKSSLENDPSSLEDNPSSSEGDRSSMIHNNNTATSQPTTIAAVEEMEMEEDPEPQTNAIAKESSAKPTPEPQLNRVGEEMSSGAAAQFSTALNELKIEINPVTQCEMKRYPDRIADALEYVRQEVKRRWVTNPTGLFVKALRNGRKPKSAPTPPAETPKPRVNLSQVECACQLAVQAGNLAFVQFKLQELITAGHLPEAQNLCDRYPAWGFVINGEAVHAAH